MDPNQALADARQAVKDFDNAEDVSESDREEAASRLTSAFAALDEWLTRGGFLPAAWNAAR